MEKINKILKQHHPVDKALPCSSALKDCKHHTFPGLNLLHEGQFGHLTNESAVTLYQKPEVNFKFPIPISSTKYIVGREKAGIDGVTSLVRKKLQWKKKKKTLYQVLTNLSAEYDMKNIEKLIKESQNNELQSMPYGVARLADHLASDPDENFDGFYNWYYGNTLTRSVVNDHSCLIHAGGENLDKLYVSFINTPENNGDILKVKPAASFSLPDRDFIYDVIASSSGGLVCIRQRNHCTAITLHIDDSGEVRFEENLYLQKKISPFISMDMKDSVFGTVTMNRRVRFWNFQKPDCVDSAKLPKNDMCNIDSFLQMKFTSDKNPYIYSVIDRHKVFLFDRRENQLKPCQTWCPAEQLELCENISLLIPSIVSNRWYIGTTHSCLLLDTRMGFIQKWTHMLRQPPCIGEAFKISEHLNHLKEAVLLGTQSTNDLVSICNSFGDEQVQNLYCPSVIPNRIATLQTARSNGLLTNPILQKKFENSLIGLTTFKRKEYFELYSMGSTGDIFYQSAEVNDFENSLNLNEKQIEHLEKWETEYNNDFSFNKFCLMSTRTTDMTEIFNSIDETIQIPEKITNPKRHLEKWKFSREKLHSCKDFLASYLIYDYGVDEIEQWYGEEINESDPILTSAKVQNWLMSTQKQDLSATNKGEIVELLQENDPVQLYETSEISVIVPPEFDSLGVPPTPKRRRTRKSRA